MTEVTMIFECKDGRLDLSDSTVKEMLMGNYDLDKPMNILFTNVHLRMLVTKRGVEVDFLEGDLKRWWQRKRPLFTIT